MSKGFLFLFLMTIGTLFAVLCLLSGAAAAMRSSDILLLLGLGLHLAIIFWLVTSSSEVDAVLEYILKVVHRFNDGIGARQ